MKKATLIAMVVTLSTVMFAGVNVTWGNTYAENATTGKLGSDAHFGVWFDVNDATSVGWENGLKVGVSGPADTSLRLGYDSGTSLGVGWNYDFGGGGKGWSTTLGTAIDFGLTDVAAVAAVADNPDTDADETVIGVTGATQGDFSITVN
ncbi:uncharacterized protein METZ01_LOCUS492048, partial [marine metagenome]